MAQVIEQIAGASQVLDTDDWHPGPGPITWLEGTTIKEACDLTETNNGFCHLTIR